MDSLCNNSEIKQQLVISERCETKRDSDTETSFQVRGEIWTESGHRRCSGTSLCEDFVLQMILSYILHYTVSECHWEQPVTNDKSDNDNWMIVKILNNQKYFDPLEKPQDF